MNIVYGNILDAKENIICHQVNCLGIMGAGLALQIRNKYPATYNKYHQICKQYKPDNLLGHILFTRENNKIIANIFGQLTIGKNTTDYKAQINAFKILKQFADNNNYSIAIPYKLGCGLAGGDWAIVYNNILQILTNNEYTIYKWNKQT